MTHKYAFKTPEGQLAVYAAYDTLLRNSNISHEEIAIETRYGKAYVLAAGAKEAPALVLLHGSAMNSAMWLNDIKRYSGHYRVYAIDMQGEPGKSDGRQLPLKGPAFSDWLTDVFTGLSLKKASILGISLGAWLALKFAIASPQMVNKLALLCPAGVGPQKASFAFMALFHQLLGEKGTERLYFKVNGEKPIPQTMLDYQKLIGKNVNYRKEQIPLFSDAELADLTMPAILFVGEKDVMLHSLKTAQRFHTFVPHAQITILPDFGHTLVGLTEELLTFLQK